jgi:hypothetical protein
MYFLRLRGIGADDFMAFAFEAVIACLLLATLYVYWRQLTPLAVHCLCVALSLLMLLANPDVIVQAKHSALDTLGPSCWAAILISFPVSLVLLALSADLDRRKLLHAPLDGLLVRTGDRDSGKKKIGD